MRHTCVSHRRSRRALGVEFFSNVSVSSGSSDEMKSQAALRD